MSRFNNDPKLIDEEFEAMLVRKDLRASCKCYDLIPAASLANPLPPYMERVSKRDNRSCVREYFKAHPGREQVIVFDKVTATIAKNNPEMGRVQFINRPNDALNTRDFEAMLKLLSFDEGEYIDVHVAEDSMVDFKDYIYYPAFDDEFYVEGAASRDRFYAIREQVAAAVWHGYLKVTMFKNVPSPQYAAFRVMSAGLIGDLFPTPDDVINE